MNDVYVVVATRKLLWGEDRREMLFSTPEAAEIAANKIMAKFANGDTDFKAKIIARPVLCKKDAENTELVLCILR